MSHASLLIITDQDPTMEHIGELMAPYDENGEFFSDGSRWDYWTVGGRYSGKFPGGKNVVQLKQLTQDACIEHKREQARDWWEDIKRGVADNNPFYREYVGMTLEDYIARHTKTWFPTFYSVLRSPNWHERGRMGWWGMEAKTECEVHAPEKEVKRCKCKSAHAPEAYIVSWKDDEETWNFKFHDRFIKDLPPETWLVAVDYHV